MDREGAAIRVNRKSEDLPERCAVRFRTKLGAFIPMDKKGNPRIELASIRGFFVLSGITTKIRERRKR